MLAQYIEVNIKEHLLSENLQVVFSHPYIKSNLDLLMDWPCLMIKVS